MAESMGGQSEAVEDTPPELSTVVPEERASNSVHDAVLENNGEGAGAEVVVAVTVIDDFVKARSMEAPVKARGCCTRRKALVLSSCFFVIAALVGCSLFFFWPRDPDWRVVKLNLDSGKFISAMLSGRSSQPMNLTADVQFWNPNYVSTVIEPSKFKVYLGSDVMAWGDTNATSILPQSSSFIRAYVTVGLDANLAGKILAEVLANNMLLKVLAEVEALAHVFMFDIKVLVRCEVTSDTNLIVSPKPEETIVEKRCTYRFSL